ncbi:TPA: hypothetical protein OMQ51_002077 [Acinetobacter baumannii]|nr:hypothetical protein [Acinetobacter baumannii]
MGEEMKIIDNSKERVALELMIRIAESEKVNQISVNRNTNPREYFLKLYNQCHKVVSWNGIDIKDVLSD